MVRQLPSQTSDLIYPESDGKPLADNTVQFRLIVTLQGGIETLFRDDPTVFVAGDLFWYPVEGHPEIVQAPDVMVVLGRPKGDRRSYRQWEEENIPPQVVFEIASKNNTQAELEGKKLAFYERYGVEEYYLYNPDRDRLKGWLRSQEKLQPIASMLGWVSPQLGIRFELSEGELQIYQPNGDRFGSYVEVSQQLEEERQHRREEQVRFEAEKQRLEAEKLRLEAEKQQERDYFERLLRENGIDPDRLSGRD